MAQPVLGVFDADAVSREAAGVIVPEFVKGDIDAGCFGQAFKLLGPVARVLEFAEGVGQTGLVYLYLARFYTVKFVMTNIIPSPYQVTVKQ